jgi:hypothetical protein
LSASAILEASTQPEVPPRGDARICLSLCHWSELIIASGRTTNDYDVHFLEVVR